MNSVYYNSEKNIQGVSLVIGPLLFAASTFYWKNGEYNVPAATLLILSLFFWIPALSGLFSLLKDAMPRYAIWGLWIAVFGCISGICFAFLGYLTTIFGISHETYLQALSKYPISSNILLFMSGPLFPLSLLVLGINLIRTKSVQPWAGILLCLGAIAFPVSRVSRVQEVAHIADIFLLVPCIYFGFIFLSYKEFYTRSS